MSMNPVPVTTIPSPITEETPYLNSDGKTSQGEDNNGYELKTIL
jgi:hypothetical protein